MIRFRCGFTRSRLRLGSTRGIARDHGYRLAVLGADRFAGRSVLDVGAFDGFYSFLAEARGARRVVAVDNEQYVDWVRARFGVTLQGGAGFRAIAGRARIPRRVPAHGRGRSARARGAFRCCVVFRQSRTGVRIGSRLLCLRMCWWAWPDRARDLRLANPPADAPAIEVHEPGDVYARDDFVYWGFSAEGLRGLARLAGFDEVEVVDELEIDGHPRILAVLRAAG